MRNKLQNLSMVFVAGLVGFFFATPVSAQSDAAKAKAVVAGLYKAKPSPFNQTKDRALLDKFFTYGLAEMIWKDATAANGEVGAIDGDPLYNAQDMKIKNLVIGDAVRDGRTGTVRVTFTNFGKKRAITYKVVKARRGGGWLIDDIVYDKDNSLRKWLKDYQ